jgi:hypothetical protein
VESVRVKAAIFVVVEVEGKETIVLESVEEAA